MARHPFSACVSGLLIALASAAESQELPDLVIDPPPPSMLTEGDTIRARVKLDSPITMPATVSFSVTPSDLLVTFKPPSLTFTSDNAEVWQPVTVEVGHDDDAVQAVGSFTYSIVVGDMRLDRTLPPITILDDDTAALSLSRARRVDLIEGGNSVRYEISLTAEPTEEVTVELSLEGAQPRQVSIDPATIVFTPGSWDQARTVTLQAPGGTGVAPLMDAAVLHTATGAQEFRGMTASLALSVRAPPPAVSELSVRSLPDGFEVSWTSLSELVAGYRVEFLLESDMFGRPGTNPGEFVGDNEASYRVGGLARDSLYQVRIVAFVGSEASPDYGVPSAARIVVTGEGAEVDPAFSGSADAASALVALGFGSSLLEAVAARIAGDREPVAHASSAALASWSRVFDGFVRSGAVLSVHERSSQERAESERARRAERRGWGLPAGGPVQRGDSSIWARVDLPGLGGQVDAFSLDGSARILHLGIERSIEPPASFDRFSEATDPDGEWLAGIGLGFASASVDIDSASVDIDLSGASLNQAARLVYPYLGYRDDRKLGYALIGGGFGTSNFRHPSFQPDAADQDSLHLFAGLGGSVVVTGRPDRTELLFRTSVLGALANVDAGPYLLTSTVVAYRARMGLDARHARSMGGGILSPTAGLGLLYDGGDGPSGKALEADAGTRFDWRRFSFSVHARTLLTSSDDLDRTLNLSGAVRYAPDGLNRGFFLTVSPSYGSGPEQGSSRDRGLVSSDPETSALRLTAEAGFALAAAPVPGRVTVVAGVDSGLHDASHGLARAGIRYQSRTSLAVGLTHTFELSDARRTSMAFHIRWPF